jgi:hypothetical protein
MDAPFGKDPIKIFNDTIVRKFIADDRIKTIEFCENGGVGNLEKAHYVLHVVGNLKILREIIIDTIHKDLSMAGVKCGTRVIPPAEHLSTNEYPSLSETNTNVWERTKIKDMISYNIAEDDPFLIKRLAEAELKQICNIYEYIIKLCDYKEREGADDKILKNTKRNLNRFIY